MAQKNVIKKSVNIDTLKQKVFSDVSMMSGIKVKGVDTTPNSMTLKCKTGKTTVTTGQDNTVITSSARFLPIWMWDLFLDRARTKKVHNKVVEIVTAQ